MREIRSSGLTRGRGHALPTLLIVVWMGFLKKFRLFNSLRKVIETSLGPSQADIWIETPLLYLKLILQYIPITANTC